MFRFVDRDMSMRFQGGAMGHRDPSQAALPERYTTPEIEEGDHNFAESLPNLLSFGSSDEYDEADLDSDMSNLDRCTASPSNSELNSSDSGEQSDDLDFGSESDSDGKS
jgi:hypothetical protein